MTARWNPQESQTWAFPSNFYVGTYAEVHVTPLRTDRVHVDVRDETGRAVAEFSMVPDKARELGERLMSAVVHVESQRIAAQDGYLVPPNVVLGGE